MRILFISFYFPPDLSAGSFRAGELVRALSKKMGEGDIINVLTTQPNRYASYTANAPELERQGLVVIKRFSIPSHQSGVVDQSLAYTRFVSGVWREIASERYDLVIATTSRLMTGFLGAAVARRLGIPLYLDIRDIFTETMGCLLSGRVKKSVLPAFRWMERFAVRTASRINLVSEGFKPYFEEITEKHKLVFYPNGIDEEFILYDFHKNTSREHPLILYAGNIGAGQGLHRIIPPAARRLACECRFLVVGDGSMRRNLENELVNANVTNVQVIDPVPRSRLLELYAQADYLFLHLNDYSAFSRVLPSKIFEYAATGKPILAGVTGYSRDFILKHVSRSAVFNPCDMEGFVGAFRSLSIGVIDRNQFVRKFRRKTIMRGLASDILQGTKV